MQSSSKITSLQSPSSRPTTSRIWLGKLLSSPEGTLGLGKRRPRYFPWSECRLRGVIDVTACEWQGLLAKNAKVYIATRDEEKTKAAIEDLKLTTGKEAIFLKLDLSSLASIKAAAEEFLRWARSHFQRVISSDLCFNPTRKEPELHVLFNNACAWFPLYKG